MRLLLTISAFLILAYGHAQTLGGSATYNFLKLPSGPLLTAAGGANVSLQAHDAGLSVNNPGLLHAAQHYQVQMAFNSFIAGIKTYALTGIYYYEPYQTSMAAHIYFLDYGSIPQTDASGNENGNFRPVDFVIQFSAARPYLDKWNYGASLKFIHSSYGQYRSSAIATDVGIHYSDSANNFYAGFTAKNMGFQLKTYAGEGEDLPFDLQVGVTKKLANAPFGFSLTAQQLHRFNVLYNDTTFNNENDLPGNDKFINKLFNHIVVATHIYIGRNLEAGFGYSHLRRNELNAGTAGNGLNGFSMGIRLKFKKIQFAYSRSNYQRNLVYNQVGITLHADKLFGFTDL